MTEFKIEVRKLKLSVRGQEHFLTFPSVGQMRAIQKTIAEAKPADVTDLIGEYFVKMGLPLEVVENDLDGDSFMELFAVLHGKKN